MLTYITQTFLIHLYNTVNEVTGTLTVG